MGDNILRLPQVIKRVGLSRSTIYALINQDHNPFPRPIELSGSRAIGWTESQIDAWIDERIRASKEAGVNHVK